MGHCLLPMNHNSNVLCDFRPYMCLFKEKNKYLKILKNTMGRPHKRFDIDTMLWRTPGGGFVTSKKDILRLIDHGAKAIDPGLTTCLSPNYSNTSMGWILQQKTCHCLPVSILCFTTGWRIFLAGGKFCNKAESTTGSIVPNIPTAVLSWP